MKVDQILESEGLFLHQGRHGASLLVLLLICLGATMGHAGDLDILQLQKSLQFFQNGSGAPVVDQTNGYTFTASIKMTQPGFIGSASLRTPTGGFQNFEQDGDDKLRIRRRFTPLFDLDQTYPNGNFAITVHTLHEGSPQFNLRLDGNQYPNAPHVVTYDANQVSDAGAYIRVGWAPFNGGGLDDWIQLKIETLAGIKVYETPDFGELGALNGRAQYALIPPGNLEPNQTYQAILIFQKTIVDDRFTYRGSILASGYQAHTDFLLRTKGLATRATVETVLVEKGRRYKQELATGVTPDANEPVVFQAVVAPAEPSSVSGAQVLLPNGIRQLLGRESVDDDFLYRVRLPSAPELDATFPSGDYAVEIQTAAEGSRRVNLPLRGDNYPPAPVITNLAAFATTPAEYDFEVQWARWQEGSSIDFIELQIEDADGKNIFDSPGYPKTKSLRGQADRFVVPRGTLRPGGKYSGTLTFFRVNQVDERSIPGAVAFSGYSSRTKFEFSTAPADVDTFHAFKGRTYSYPSADAQPVQQLSRGFLFESRVRMAAPGSVTQAHLQRPQGTVETFVKTSPDTWQANKTYSSQADLNAANPPGLYTFITTGVRDGRRQVFLPMPADAYPEAPRILRLQNAQSIDPLASFVLEWEPFNGGTADDFIQVEISDTAGAVLVRSPDYGKSGALNGTKVQLFLPIGTFNYSQTYRARVTFYNLTTIDRAAYQGATGYDGFFARTSFPLQSKAQSTPPPPPTAPRLRIVGGNMVFDAQPQASYSIQESNDLRSWMEIQQIEAGQSGPIEIPFNFGLGTRQFLRVLAR